MAFFIFTLDLLYNRFEFYIVNDQFTITRAASFMTFFFPTITNNLLLIASINSDECLSILKSAHEF